MFKKKRKIANINSEICIKNNKLQPKNKNYCKIKHIKVCKKIAKMKNFYYCIFPEYNIDLEVLEHGEDFVNSKIPNLKFRKVYSVTFAEYVANKIVAGYLKGYSLNDLLTISLKKYSLFKKEINMLRLCIIKQTLIKIIEIEKFVYVEKKNIKRGINYNRPNLPKNFSNGFAYGLAKNKNLGYFTEFKSLLTEKIGLFICDLDYFESMIKSLISLLIKCV